MGDRPLPLFAKNPSTPGALLRVSRVMLAKSWRDEAQMGELSLSIFTIEADRKPIMAFAAKKHQDAEVFFGDERVRVRLQLSTSGGKPVLDDRSILRVRIANAAERAVYRERTAGLATPGVVFLIKIDEA
jgi:hypothetical protein